MIKKISLVGYLLVLILGVTFKSQAYESGPVVANNILGGAMAGAAVGLSSGFLAYGVNGNSDAETILLGTVYGFLGGAIFGTGLGIYEIVLKKPDTGYTLFNYVAGGTGIGAFLGTVVAVIPFVQDRNGADFTIGLGLGGVIGAAFGLGFSVLDIEARTSGGDVLLSGRIGVQPESLDQPILCLAAQREPVFGFRLVQVSF